MKKLLALLLSLTFIFSLSACSNKPVSSGTNDANAPQWEQFLSDYEAWVDKYVELTKKVSDNPSDLSILSDYTEMAEEALEWQTKADELSAELEDASPAELAEYSAALAKIATKLANAY